MQVETTETTLRLTTPIATTPSNSVLLERPTPTGVGTRTTILRAVTSVVSIIGTPVASDATIWIVGAASANTAQGPTSKTFNVAQPLPSGTVGTRYQWCNSKARHVGIQEVS